MSIKTFCLFLATISALGVGYFAVDALISLGDYGALATADLRVLVTALAINIVPIVVAFGGVWWVSRAQSAKGYIGKLLASSAIAWAWLFVGSIYLALLRFQ
jgi:hypothetical protein